MSEIDPRRRPAFRVRLLLARCAVDVERIWPAIWPAFAVVVGFLALSLFGVWHALPGWLHLAGVIVMFGAFGWLLSRGLRTWRPARDAQGLARLERDSGLVDQPLQALGDNLASGEADPLTQAMWEAHRRQVRDAAAKVVVAPPRSQLPALDQWALRALLLLILVVSLVDARGRVGERLVSAFTPAAIAAPATAPIETLLWITPPAYTRLAPFSVASGAAGPAAAPVAVPTGSEALVQIHHLAGDTNGHAAALGATRTALTVLGGGSAEARLPVDASGRLGLVDPAGTELAGWDLAVTPDLPPTVAFQGVPQATPRGVMRLGYDAADDYGLVGIALTFTPVEGGGPEERVTVTEPSDQPKTIKGNSYLDLTPHPLAGLPVRARIEAVDAKGQKGTSEEIEFVLPSRPFQHPLARAVIAQRRELAARRVPQDEMANRLGSLARLAAGADLGVAAPLGLRAAAARLAYTPGEESRTSVIDMLWEIALYIEDGTLSLAERDLRKMQEKLEQALADNADNAELEKLMNELEQAMDRFLEEMQRRAQEQGQNPQEQAQPNQQGEQKTVDRQDLQEMLDRAREMMRNGAKDAARDLMAQLRDMLENLQAQTQQAEASPGEQALSDLQKMIQQQQQLMDQTSRLERQQRGDQQGKQDGQQPGQQQGQQQGQGQGQQPGTPGEVAGQQDALRQALGELMRQMGEAGMPIPRSLGQAELQMRSARGSLQEGMPGDALDNQSEAIDQLQQGGQAMLDQMRQQMGEQQGQQQGQGRLPSQQSDRGRDPLGRSVRNDGGINPEGTAVPDESSLGQARDVLEELFRRTRDRNRPTQELDYYDRLLDRF